MNLCKSKDFIAFVVNLFDLNIFITTKIQIKKNSFVFLLTIDFV